MNNLHVYEQVRNVPDNAQKTIEAGTLKGFTDINPMWRIKKLTEIYGPCGIGWYTEKLKEWIELGADGRAAAFVDINLYVKENGEWSKPIFGTGGSMFINIFKGSQVSSDECYKMAYTDALGVACKALGFGADVYWEKDRTKYNQQPIPQEQPKPESDMYFRCDECGEVLKTYNDANGKPVSLRKHAEKSKTMFDGRVLCLDCIRKIQNDK